MVGINETDKDMLRFFWFKDPGDLKSEIEHSRFTRLLFGLRPSPAIFTIDDSTPFRRATIRRVQDGIDRAVKEFPCMWMISLPAKQMTIRCWICTRSPNQLCSEADSICENGTLNRPLYERQSTDQLRE